MNRKKKLALNTATSLLLQVTTVVCGFILPLLILHRFGSEVNGLVNSITQFLAIISFLELGVGAVIQSALYKPLADQDNVEISKIVASGEKFFRWIAYILTVYVALLVCFYPRLINANFGWLYTALLIAAISIRLFGQYYFGIINRLLLNSDQRGYIQYTTQILTLIANTVACYVLIKLGYSIQLVMLVTSLIFLIQPLVWGLYVNRHYRINRKIKYEGEPIKQKWNGVAQHISAIVLADTGTVVLTFLSTLGNVSIYSVYYLVVGGVRSFFMSAIGGVQSLMGEMLARKETENLNRFFGMVEFTIHTGVTCLFTCTGILILPFISIYTKGITDANYIQPLFAVLFVSAFAGYCLRLPYNIAILAGGHYKQTQSNYIIAAILNVIISVIGVYLWGLIGVAIGTLVAMVYQTVWMAIYDSKNLIYWPIRNFLKQCLVDALNVGLIILATKWITLGETSYLSWVIMSIKVTLIATAVIALVSFLFYHRQLSVVVSAFAKRLRKKR